MTQFYLIRHGETEWNVAGRLQGHSDSPLTINGRQQVKNTAKRLQHVPFKKIYTSDLGRAVQTAQILAQEHAITYESNPQLREVSFGTFEGMDAHAYQNQIRDMHKQREILPFEESLHFRIHPTFETMYETSERMLNTLRSLKKVHQDETIAIVTHGGTMRHTLLRVLEVHVSDLPPNCIGNAAYFSLLLEKNKFILGEMEGIQVPEGDKKL